jgi:hypothetical protein
VGLIAEDLLLLLLDDEKGTVVGTSFLPTALGGAVLVELALDGAVTAEEKHSAWRSARVHAEPGTAPADDVLRRALAVVAEKDRAADDLVQRLGKGLKEELAERLVRRGILERHEQKVLGLIPRTRWPSIDTSHEQEVRRALTAALVEGAEPDHRTAGLIALLSAIDRAHKVVDHEGLSARAVKQRAKEIAEGDWAAKAVKDAITATIAAVTAVAAAATVASSGT